MYSAAVARLSPYERKTNMASIPEFLPTLSSGAHSAEEGKACVMEYVSILAGEKFSDHPSCTDPVLAAAARAVNDWMTDEGRSQLVPLIGRLFGTASRGSDEVGVQLAEFINSYVHQVIAEGAIGDPDGRLIAYMTAILDKFDELTGFSYAETGRKLTNEEYQALNNAVAVGTR